MNLHTIAWYKRTPPDSHNGGVPLFNHYMARVFDAKEWSWSDYPKPLPRVDEPTAALLLGNWLSAPWELYSSDAVIVDGFWGRGLYGWEYLQPGRVQGGGAKVISVAHGTWRGIARALNSESARRLGDVQAEEYRRLPVIAVSEATANELRELYGVEPAAVIRNGVDTDEFKPREKTPRDRPVIIYPSDAYPKGGDIVKVLRERNPQWEFRLLGAAIGEEAEKMAQGDVFLAPSRTEGCSYAALQALSCGLPVVTADVGMFKKTNGELDGINVGITVQVSEPIDEWEGALQICTHGRGRDARAWAVEHGSLTRWEKEWRDFLTKVCGN